MKKYYKITSKYEKTFENLNCILKEHVLIFDDDEFESIDDSNLGSNPISIKHLKDIIEEMEYKGCNFCKISDDFHGYMIEGVDVYIPTDEEVDDYKKYQIFEEIKFFQNKQKELSDKHKEYAETIKELCKKIL